MFAGEQASVCNARNWGSSSAVVSHCQEECYFGYKVELCAPVHARDAVHTDWQ